MMYLQIEMLARQRHDTLVREAARERLIESVTRIQSQAQMSRPTEWQLNGAKMPVPQLASTPVNSWG